MDHHQILENLLGRTLREGTRRGPLKITPPAGTSRRAGTCKLGHYALQLPAPFLPLWLSSPGPRHALRQVDFLLPERVHTPVFGCCAPTPRAPSTHTCCTSSCHPSRYMHKVLVRSAQSTPDLTPENWHIFDHRSFGKENCN